MTRTPPILRQYAALWTLNNQPSPDREWSIEEKFRQAKKAGFDGMGGRALPGIAALCEKFGMDYVCYLDANMDTYEKRLQAAAKAKPARLNVQLCDHDTPPQEAVKVWLKMEVLAEKLGLNMDMEVHRDTCTETPEKVWEIAALYKRKTGRQLRFCWDFSHFAVVKHVNPPYAKRLLDHPSFIQAARQFHFRPFNGHHAQVPATDGRKNETPEFKDYLQFLDALLACWMAGAKGGEVVHACPEFGPMGEYGLSVFSNPWKDAIYLREKTEKLWKKHLRAFRAR